MHCCSGAVVQYCSCAVVLWCSGAVVQWCCVSGFVSLFEDESKSDVVLLVGEGGAMERVPAHSWVLTHSNGYFRSVLDAPTTTATKTELRFPNDQPKGFINFIRWLYGYDYSPRTTQGALDTLQVSIKYFAFELVENIVDYLLKNLLPDNVLQIMAWAHQYSSNTTSGSVRPSDVPDDPRSLGQHLAPSAPPVECGEDLPPPYPGTAPPPSYDAIYDNTERDPTMGCRHLVTKCFVMLDAMADGVLASEAVEEVSAPLLSAVLSRNSLGVSSEKTVLDALLKWSSAECRRQHLPLDMEGRRQVLGQMLTLPRLLTLKIEQLGSLNKLYDKAEVEYISAVVRRSNNIPAVPPTFVGYVEQMSRRRQSPTDLKQNKDKKDKQKGSSKKLSSAKQLMWDIFSIFAHMID
ncbi:BTB/POZ domain [Trinorchestia longiramus]|nr:BTB/POZ domain [Trinorchestia longiramus]